MSSDGLDKLRQKIADMESVMAGREKDLAELWSAIGYLDSLCTDVPDTRPQGERGPAYVVAKTRVAVAMMNEEMARSKRLVEEERLRCDQVRWEKELVLVELHGLKEDLAFISDKNAEQRLVEMSRWRFLYNMLHKDHPPSDLDGRDLIEATFQDLRDYFDGEYVKARDKEQEVANDDQ